MKNNVIVGQSGGPTSVINSSLAGVYRTAIDRGAGIVYGMRNGIQGLLEGRYVDLSEHITSDLDVELLKRTPSAYLGSCRYKLPEIHEDRSVYEKIFKILNELEIGYFFYIGGNDSMDTIRKLSDYAIVYGEECRFIGVPKTIDNDLAVTDHTPGFGSAAKFIGTVTKECLRDGLVYGNELVTIIEVMGRNAGWLTSAVMLAKSEDCEGPDLIYVPEVPFDVEKFIDKIREIQKVKKTVVVAVSEGVRLADGRYVCELAENVDFVDAFGHKQLTGTASYLCNRVAAEIGCKTRSIELSSLQRCASHLASRIDINEAFQVGGAAVKAAFEGDNGKMIILKRISDDPYQCTSEVYDVHKISNVEKKLPLEWIINDGTYISDEFIDYARPLIRGDVPAIMVNGIPRHLYFKETDPKAQAQVSENLKKIINGEA